MFEQWNETQPGFLGADLVAHCGTQLFTFHIIEYKPRVLTIDRPEALQISTSFAKDQYTFERFFLS